MVLAQMWICGGKVTRIPLRMEQMIGSLTEIWRCGEPSGIMLLGGVRLFDYL